MTTRFLPSQAFALALGGGSFAAQVPGDADYEPDPDTVDEYELLGEETESGYVFDPDAFSGAADRTAAEPPDVSTPSGAEIKEFRAGLEAHWGGNLAALLAYLQSINPAAGDNPEPREEGVAPHWAPDDDYDSFGNLIETAEEERARWRARVESKLAQMAAQ